MLIAPMHAGLGGLHRIELVVDRARPGRRGCRSRRPRHRAGRSRRGACSSKCGLPSRCAMLSLRPVKKLSTQRTSWPLRQQALAQVRAEEAGAAGDQDAAAGERGAGRLAERGRRRWRHAAWYHSVARSRISTGWVPDLQTRARDGTGVGAIPHREGEVSLSCLTDPPAMLLPRLCFFLLLAAASAWRCCWAPCWRPAAGRC